MKLFPRIKSFFIQKKVLFVVTLVVVGFVAYNIFGGSKQTQTYQTATVDKGTLIVSVSESGQVSSANNTSVSTQMSGVVKKVYVQNGDTVKQGDKLADLELDQPSQAKQQSALANYQQAQTTLQNAQAQLYSLQSQMFTDWQAYMNQATSTTYQNGDGSANTTSRVETQFTIPQTQWLAAQAQYKNQQGIITQAQTAQSSAWLTYQQSSATITAPISGTVIGLSVQEGSVIASSSNTSSSTSTSSTSTSSSNSSTKIASIKTAGNPLVTVNLSEVDVPNIKSGQKATLTFDALPNKTFAGHVFSVDTTGAVSSGVTTYPAIIELDDANESILPNMSVTANIITKTKDDVLLVPSAAVHTTNGTSTVQVIKNGETSSVDVTTGDASDTQTEIVSGLTEGETVVIGSTATTTTTSSTTSPFSSRGFGLGGGGTSGRTAGR